MTATQNPEAWAEPEAATRRLFRNLVISAVAMTTAGFVFGGAKVAAGRELGGGLALLNFRWLAGSVRGILAISARRVPPGTAMKIALRWLVVAAAGYAGYWTGYFSAAGILIGLLAPAPAVLFESIYLTSKTVRGQGSGVGGR